MKAITSKKWVITGGVLLSLVLLASLATAAFAHGSGPSRWGSTGQYNQPAPFSNPTNDYGPMMGRGGFRGGNWGSMESCARFWGDDPTATPLTRAEARSQVEGYIESLGYDNLEVAEVMEFDNQFYAEVRESDTGIGAMEVLVNRWNGTVPPEFGPNMMWNTKYGHSTMMGQGWGGMMGGSGWYSQPQQGATALSPEQAIARAQEWLDLYRPGLTVGYEADAFYGYYTIHTLNDGETVGMLSVNGATGAVWYHTWHGTFLGMDE